MSVLYVSNDGTTGFDATGALPSGFAQISGTWAVGTVNPSNGHTRSIGCTSALDGNVGIFTGATATADVEIFFCQPNMWSSGAHGTALGPMVRMNAAGNQGYLGIIFPQSATAIQWQLFRVSGGYSMLTSADVTGLTAGVPIFARFQIVGTAIRGRVWSQGVVEPTTWQLNTTDGSITAAGYCGWYAGQAGGSTNGTVIPATDVTINAAGANEVMVNQPGAQGLGAVYTLTGVYQGTAPTGMDYGHDSTGAWTNLLSFTATGNTWSGLATAPSTPGLHFVYVRDSGTTTNQAASAAFTVANTSSISAPGVSGLVAGGTSTISGTFTGGAPSGLTQILDSSPSTVGSPTITTTSGSGSTAAGTWSYTITTPGSGTHSIQVNGTGSFSSTGSATSFNVTGAPSISAPVVSGLIPGGSSTISGTFGGGAPSGLSQVLDSATSTVSSSTITTTTGSGATAAGTWSYTITTPAAGTHSIQVNGTGTFAATGSPTSFTTGTAPSPTISAPGVSGLVPGGSTTISGTFTNGAPTGLSQILDAATTTVGGPTITTTSGSGSTAAGTYAYSITTPAAGSHNVQVNGTGTFASTGSPTSFTTSVSSTTINASNPGIIYSPYNWNVASGTATTINSGAYFRTMFSGSQISLLFDVSHNSSPLSELWIRIDDGPLTRYAVASSISPTIPADTAGNADVPYHLLTVIVKATSETLNRWNSPSNTAIVFSSLVLAVGAAVAAPGRAPLNILCYGDSITEGVRCLGESAPTDTARNDGEMVYSHRLGALLGAEVGVVGFGATGLNTGGSGNVPALQSSYNFLYGGAARVFSPVPDLIVFNEGTNDGGSITTNLIIVLNSIMAACPTSAIVVLQPFNGSHVSDIQAAIAGCNAPQRVRYGDTTGFYNPVYGTDGLNLHPSGPNHAAMIAPQVAALLRPSLPSPRATHY